MTQVQEYLGHHPYVGAIVSGVHLFVGVCLGVVNTEIPTIVMQLFQLGAWGAGIAAGLFTCYGVWKTHHGKKRKK